MHVGHACGASGGLSEVNYCCVTAGAWCTQRRLRWWVQSVDISRVRVGVGLELLRGVSGWPSAHFASLHLRASGLGVRS